MDAERRSRAQKLLVARLRVQGVVVQPEFSYTRAVNGFSAAFDARGIALLERAPDVAGVYPGAGGLSRRRSARRLLTSTGLRRAAEHRAVRQGRSRRHDRAPRHRRRSCAALPARSCRRWHRHRRRRSRRARGATTRTSPPSSSGTARRWPASSSAPVGPVRSRASHRVRRCCRSASRAGSETRRQSWAVYGRTDQVLAGLERAVDPNGDGDAHDAARVALVGVAEPFAGFADGPFARAAAGATRLDTLVVAPAGNDGPAGPGYGSVAGPGRRAGSR